MKTSINKGEEWLDYIPEKRTKYQELLKDLSPEIEEAFDKFIDVTDVDGSTKITDRIEKNYDKLPLEKVLQMIKKDWEVYLEINRTIKKNNWWRSSTVWPISTNQSEILNHALIHEEIKSWDIITFLHFEKNDENNYKVSIKQVEQPRDTTFINKWLIFVNEWEDVDINDIQIAS